MEKRWDIITLTKQRQHITHKSSHLSQSSTLGEKSTFVHGNSKTNNNLRVQYNS